MTTYPLEVVPPQSTVLKDGFVTEDELRQSPQNFFEVIIYATHLSLYSS